MLVSGRVRAIVGNVIVTKYYAGKYNVSDEITFLPHPVRRPRAFSILISKNSKLPDIQKVYEHFETILSGMLMDGTFDEIYLQYGLTFKDYSGGD